MLYKSNESKIRKIDDDLEITDLFEQNDYPFDLVIGNLDGFHGTFINNRSIKYYQILEGSGIITIDDKEYEVSKGDFIVVEKGQKHSLKGKMQFNIICTPAYNFNDEIVISQKD